MKLIINQCELDLSRTKIMGILNITPDSFSDGGDYYICSKALDRVDYMINHGATFIDIGGESTRPGASSISEEEEADRVVPIIRAVSQRFDIFISVNTSSALVIRESAAAGAHLINDVRSLIFPEAMQAVLHCKLPVCLMHHNTNKNFQITRKSITQQYDILKEVNEYFIEQISRCVSAGISRSSLLIDPGFGFGKNLIYNYKLLANLNKLHHFKLPILIGISRKSMLSINYRNQQHRMIVNPKKRVIGSITGAVIAAMQGVHIIRVHDVKETAEALCIIDAMSMFS